MPTVCRKCVTKYQQNDELFSFLFQFLNFNPPFNVFLYSRTFHSISSVSMHPSLSLCSRIWKFFFFEISSGRNYRICFTHFRCNRSNMYTPKTILYILIKFTLCNASSSSDTNTLCDSIKNHQNVSDDGVIILKSEENHVYLSRTENNFSFSRKCHSTGKLEKEIISQVSSKCTKQHNEQIISDLLLYMPKFTTQSSVPIVCAVFEGLQQCPSHLVFELKFHAFEFTIFNIHSDCTSQTQHILRTDSEFKISQTFYGIWRIFDFCMGILTLLLISIFLLINWRTLALKLQNTRCTFLFYIVFTACHVWNISILVSVTTYQNLIGQQSIYNFKELLDFQIRQPNNTPFTTYFKLKAKTPPL